MGGTIFYPPKNHTVLNQNGEDTGTESSFTTDTKRKQMIWSWNKNTFQVNFFPKYKRAAKARA